MGGKLGQCEIRIFPHSHPEADSVVSGQTKRLFCSEGRPADIRAFSGMKFSKETYLGAMYTYDFCGVRVGVSTKSDYNSTDKLYDSQSDSKYLKHSADVICTSSLTVPISAGKP